MTISWDIPKPVDVEQPQRDQDQFLGYQMQLLADRRPDVGMNDETPRKNLHTRYNPLNHYQSMQRGTAEAFAPEGIMLGDLTPDARGWKTEPDFRNYRNYSWQTTKKIEQSLYNKNQPFSIIDSNNDMKNINAKFQQHWQIGGKYFKNFDESLTNQHFIVMNQNDGKERKFSNSTQETAIIEPRTEYSQNPYQVSTQNQQTIAGLSGRVITDSRNTNKETQQQINHNNMIQPHQIAGLSNKVIQDVKYGGRRDLQQQTRTESSRWDGQIAGLSGQQVDDARQQTNNEHQQYPQEAKMALNGEISDLTSKIVSDGRRKVGEYTDLTRDNMSIAPAFNIELIQFCHKHKDQLDSYLRTGNAGNGALQFFNQLQDMPIKQQYVHFQRLAVQSPHVVKQFLQFIRIHDNQLFDQHIKQQLVESTRRNFIPDIGANIQFQHILQHKLAEEKIRRAEKRDGRPLTVDVVKDVILEASRNPGMEKTHLERQANIYIQQLNAIPNYQIQDVKFKGQHEKECNITKQRFLKDLVNLSLSKPDTQLELVRGMQTRTQKPMLVKMADFVSTLVDGIVGDSRKQHDDRLLGVRTVAYNNNNTQQESRIQQSQRDQHATADRQIFTYTLGNAPTRAPALPQQQRPIFDN